MKKGVLKTYINVVEDIFVELRTIVKGMCELTKDFRIRVGVHQGTALSPCLFSVVMDENTMELQVKIPLCMMFDDDIVLVGEIRKKVNQKLDVWRLSLERN